MSSTLIKAGALALACASTVSATLKYTLAPGDNYEGGNFFEKFDFKAIVDPTAGYVQYQSKQSAESNAFGAPLVKYENGQAYMGVDYKNQYDPNGVGRPSVRIESQKQYNYGLFVLDIAHMPENVCGTWPAFWTFNELDYPKWGEIDILENINEQTQTLETLHTTPTCSVAGNHFGLQELGQQTTYNCDDQATTGPFGTTQYQYQGCSAVNTSPNNYGKALNAAGGAVYAMEWTKDAISVWNFQPGNVPANLVAGNPDTSSWGLPQFTTAQGDCDIDSHFKDHKVVLDTTFCGSWAGLPEMWSQTSCYDKVKYPRCQDYVAAHPEAYAGAYWLFNSMKVYQKTEVVSSTSSSSSTSSTSSSSTSSTSVSTTSSTSASTTDSSVTTSSTGSTATTSPTDSTVITSPTVSSSSTGGPIYSNSSSSSTSAEMTTSTVYTTSVYTVTSCAPTVTNCPVGSVTTATISLYTTVCPVSSSGPGPKTTPPPKSTYTPPPPSSVPQTSTVVITKIHTITSCAAGVVNCPGRKSTEYLTTTACFTPEVKQPSNLPVFTYTTWIKGVNATMTVPVGSGHGGHAKGTAAVTKTTLSFNAGVPATATPVTPIVPVVEGGASGLKVSGVIALVAGVLAMLL